MNVVLWVVQVLLAFHTVAGAAWKLSNSEQMVPSLTAIPHGAWLTLSAIEMLCTVCLLVPAFYRPLAILVPIAALFIAAEMLLFVGLHLRYDAASEVGPMIYWLVVAAVCGFVAYGRSMLKPL